MEQVIVAMLLPGMIGGALVWIAMAFGHVAGGFFRNAVVEE